MNTKVKFTVPADVVSDATNGLLLGDFNNWDPSNGIVLQKKKDGSLAAEVELEAGQTYQYRYLLSDGRWVNDKNASIWNEVFGQQVENNIVSVPVAKEKAVAEKKDAAPKAAAPKATKKAPVKKEAAKKSTTVKPAEVKPVAAKATPKKAAKKATGGNTPTTDQGK
jgi:hypothetical protein